MIAVATHSDPAWLDEIDASLGVASQFVLGGNVGDLIISRDQTGRPRLHSLVDALWARLQPSGFEFFAVYDLTDGIRIHPGPAEPVAKEVLRDLTTSGPMSQDDLAKAIERIVNSSDHRSAVLIERAGRLTLNRKSLNASEHAFFCAAERLALTATPPGKLRGDRQVGLYNPVIWIVENERELPDWFLSIGERLRSATVPSPVKDDRISMAERLAPIFIGYDELTEDERGELIERFANHAHGMTLLDMHNILQVSKDRRLGLCDVEDVVRGYRVGVLENPWKQSSLRAKVTAELDAFDLPVDERDERSITRRVLGQDEAVRRVLDILARSVTNLTGAHRGPYASGPRGVLFFAGPTGVGKTELAKRLSQLVFGSEAITRFDMSEFADENTAARLIGAPPGYVGFDAGGELTNAVRERPFSVILFDEIEKANRLVLDKFLQILEDGRLTDGRGGTVVFNEAIIVFTSNLGVIRRRQGEEPEVLVNQEQWAANPEESEAAIRAEIKRFFVLDLGRPELLNRLGNNIVVFGYINRETGERILSLLIENVAERLDREQNVRLELTDGARQALAEFALVDLSNGGRGIGSVVEDALVNPLARRLIRHMPGPGERFLVTDIRKDGATYELDCQ